jgi:hypothetical protein
MSRRELPVPWDELPGLLSRELDPARPRRLKVRSVTAGPDPLLQLVIVLDAEPPAGPPQTWRLTYDVADDDLQLLGAPAFVLTVRANIEEWWDTRAADRVHLRAVRLA